MNINILIINLLLTFLSALAISGVIGIVISILSLRETARARKRLIEIMKNDAEIKNRLTKAYGSGFLNPQSSKFFEMEKIIRSELKRLKNQSEEKKILEAIDNNTEEGKKRYISNIVAGTISLS